MARIHGNYRRPTSGPTTQIPYKRNRPRFRWWIVEVLLGLIVASWAIHSVEPAISWDWISNIFDVVHHKEFSMLGVLCIAVVGYIVIKRILRKSRR